MRLIQVLMIAAAAALTPIAGAFAQTPQATQPSPEALSAARDLVTQISRPMIAEMTSDVTAKVWPQIADAIQRKYPTIDDATIGEMRSEFERVMRQTAASAMAQAPAIYARYFTAAEMKEIAAFYRTPIGAKALTVMPKAMADFMPILMARMQSSKTELDAAFANILKRHGYAVQ